ncbi:hypothetical protein BDFG_07223, partial [Blastomyces dermatitidis ATCC 26199]
IELFRVTVSEIKLFSDFSSNDHTESYITILTETESSVTTVAEEAEKELNTDKLISRRDDISLQGTATTAAAARKVEEEEEEEEDVAMKVMLPRSVNATVSAFNQAFLTVMEGAAAL